MLNAPIPAARLPTRHRYWAQRRLSNELLSFAVRSWKFPTVALVQNPRSFAVFANSANGEGKGI